MYDFQRMLTHGYFPKELPPSFSTKLFGQYVAANRGIIATQNGCSECMSYDYARGNGLRRKLSIPNPFYYAVLCHKIELNWNHFEAVYRDNSSSITLPSFNQSQRAVTQDWSDRVSEKRLEHLHHAKHVVHIDISNFYGTVYTHAISWALHGKEIAKKAYKNKKKLDGDTIDTALRALQDRQSIGIPVGPDSSLIIAEAILSSIDKELSQKSISKYFRYMDDFEVPCNDQRAVSNATRIMEDIFKKYELSINNLKYKVSSAPFEIEAQWASELKRSKPPLQSLARPMRQRQELLYFFNKAICLSKAHPNESVLRFALSILQSIPLAADNKDIALHFILQAIMSECFVYDIAFPALLFGDYKNVASHDETLKNTLEKSIKNSIALRMPSDTSWALWCGLVFNIKFNKSTIEYIIENGDGLSQTIALHAKDILKIHRCDIEAIKRLVKYQSLSTKHWMTIYEACTNKHVKTKYQIDEISSFFDTLQQNNINFYDSTSTPADIAKMSYSKDLIDTRISLYD